MKQLTRADVEQILSQSYREFILTNNRTLNTNTKLWTEWARRCRAACLAYVFDDPDTFKIELMSSVTGVCGDPEYIRSLLHDWTAVFVKYSVLISTSHLERTFNKLNPSLLANHDIDMSVELPYTHAFYDWCVARLGADDCVTKEVYRQLHKGK